MNWLILLSLAAVLLTLAPSLGGVFRTKLKCPPRQLKNGRIRVKSRGRVIKYICSRGYQVLGDKYSTCKLGKWDTPVPICISEDCLPIDVPHGQVLETYRGAVVTVHCDPGYTLLGTQSLYCSGDAWNDTVPSCQGTQVSAQRSCDFESEDWCGWSNDANHDFDWRRHNFATPSGHIGTGPSFDHTFGRGLNGHYMYLETSSPRLENDTARLFSPVFAFTTNQNPCFKFWYHMFGLATGSLSVFLHSQDTVLIFSKSGHQGDYWQEAILPLPFINSSFQIIIEGVRGTGYEGDIAIDDVKLTEGEECIAISTESNEESSQVSDVVSCADRCFHTTDHPYLCECTTDCISNNTCCADYLVKCFALSTAPGFPTSPNEDLVDTSDMLTLPQSTYLPEGRTSPESYPSQVSSFQEVFSTNFNEVKEQPTEIKSITKSVTDKPYMTSWTTNHSSGDFWKTPTQASPPSNHTKVTVTTQPPIISKRPPSVSIKPQTMQSTKVSSIVPTVSSFTNSLINLAINTITVEPLTAVKMYQTSKINLRQIENVSTETIHETTVQSPIQQTTFPISYKMSPVSTMSITNSTILLPSKTQNIPTIEFETRSPTMKQSTTATSSRISSNFTVPTKKTLIPQISKSPNVQKIEFVTPPPPIIFRTPSKTTYQQYATFSPNKTEHITLTSVTSKPKFMNVTKSAPWTKNDVLHPWRKGILNIPSPFPQNTKPQRTTPLVHTLVTVNSVTTSRQQKPPSRKMPHTSLGNEWKSKLPKEPMPIKSQYAGSSPPNRMVHVVLLVSVVLIFLSIVLATVCAIKRHRINRRSIEDDELDIKFLASDEILDFTLARPSFDDPQVCETVR